MKTAKQYIDGFQTFKDRALEGKSKVTGDEVIALQETYFTNALLDAFKAGMTYATGVCSQSITAEGARECIRNHRAKLKAIPPDSLAKHQLTKLALDAVDRTINALER